VKRYQGKSVGRILMHELRTPELKVANSNALPVKSVCRVKWGSRAIGIKTALTVARYA
jgi:hypothetical protein